MPYSISRSVFNALLPKGPIWEILPDGDLDKLFDGISENTEYIRVYLEQLADIRNPLKTPVLEDLEKEFGILPGAMGIDEATRRARLWAEKYRASSNGSLTMLRDALTASGFDLNVYANDPAVDPAGIMYSSYASICGDDEAIFGDDYAVLGGFAGELIVNGIISIHVTGVPEEVEYTIPSATYYWPLIFFIGGDAAYNVDDEIIDIAFASVQAERRQELRRLIVKYKPLHSWCGLNVNYV